MLPHLLAVFAAAAAVCLASFTNPIKNPNGSDPYMVYNGGYYYLMTTTWTNLQITQSASVAGLKTATPKVVWTDSTASRCCNLWAPELHWKSAEGAWYISAKADLIHISYYVAGSSSTFNDQRVYALKGSSTNIWSSTWSFAGQIVPPNWNYWMIDPTVMILSSGEYLVFSAFSGSLQCLWIAKMDTALTTENAYEISCPTLSWETVGGAVNEGPVALYNGGNTWITYSASSCATSSYSLGLLKLTGSNPLSSSSWCANTAGPVFSSANGQYGTGHNYFFLSPSGSEIWSVYHYSASSAVACDGTRETAVHMMTFNSDGSPNFGVPYALTASVAEPE
ncbi:glycoside hydrolase family 43 protein [Clavulina sp. PMI_390]|nr:glycoside hydrolase family 43 protein [Clavulina sp. PMI_390]